MKKLLALFLALMMLLSVATVFAGCEDNKKKKSSSSSRDEDDEDENDDEDEDGKENDEDGEDAGKDNTTGDALPEDDKKPSSSDEDEDTPQNVTRPNNQATEQPEPQEPEEPEDTQDPGVLNAVGKAFTDYLDVAINYNPNYLKNICPDFVADYEFYLTSFTLDEIVDGMNNEEVMAFYESGYGYEKYLGEHVTAYANRVIYHELDAETESKIIASICEDYNYEAGNIDKIVKLEGEYTIAGDEGEWNWPIENYYAMLYQSQWYLVEYDEGTLDDGEYFKYSSFPIGNFIERIIFIIQYEI